MHALHFSKKIVASILFFSPICFYFAFAINSVNQSKIFVLGLGAQKGGTTWLARELRRQNVKFPFGKEGHVWNSIEGGVVNVEHVPLFDIKKDVQKKRILDSINDSDQYFEIASNVAVDTNCPVADITPAYCGLSQATLEKIRLGLLGKGFFVKVLFIARDPLSRVWSMHRMGVKRKKRSLLGQAIYSPSSEEVHAGLVKNFNSGYQKVRTQYEKTIEKIRMVFADEEFEILFFESLFTVDVYEAICSFLAIECGSPSFDVAANVSPEFANPPEYLQRTIVNYYRSTYEYMAEKYPEVKFLCRESFNLLE